MNGVVRFQKFQPRVARCMQHIRCAASRACPELRLDAHIPEYGKPVHVVWFDPTKCGDVDVGVLPPQDVEYVLRAEHKSARRQRLLARMVLRTTLSGFLNIRPEDIRFRINSHGKPYLNHDSMGMDSSVGGIHFNLTHSKTMIGLAIATGFEIGLDVEDRFRTPKCGVLKFARKKFHPREVDFLEDAQYEIARNNRFLSLWTLKEAFVKSRGVGVYTPPGLKSFGFEFSKSESEPNLISLTGQWTVDGRESQGEHSFAVFHPSAHHLAALCTNGRSSISIPSDVAFWELRLDEAHNAMVGRQIGVSTVGAGMHSRIDNLQEVFV